MPALPDLMPDLDQLIGALFLLTLLLYLIPAVVRPGESQKWFQRGAILTLGIALAIAVVASVIWLTR